MRNNYYQESATLRNIKFSFFATQLHSIQVKWQSKTQRIHHNITSVLNCASELHILEEVLGK